MDYKNHVVHKLLLKEKKVMLTFNFWTIWISPKIAFRLQIP